MLCERKTNFVLEEKRDLENRITLSISQLDEDYRVSSMCDLVSYTGFYYYLFMCW